MTAAVLAGCSSAVERFGDAPVYTGGTENQRDILAENNRQPTYQEISEGPAGTPAGLPSGSSQTRTVYTGSLPQQSATSNSAVRSAPLPEPAIVQAGEPAAPVSSRKTTTHSAQPVRAANNNRPVQLTSAAPATQLPATRSPADASVNYGNVPSPDKKPVHSASSRQVRTASVAPQQSAPSSASQPVVVASLPQQKPEEQVVSRVVTTSKAEPAVPAANKTAAPGAQAVETAAVSPKASGADVRPTEAIKRPVGVANAEPADAGAPRFRWPVRGRVISDFGSKPGGARNDGVNLAVPEGTPVKAADEGTVIYSGNELKGYGNLVLIRHDEGWVSAYAHNSELKVKRGDAVRRGDVIGLAGRTGSVTQPQVHFELRQGNKPVDPVKYLPKG
ncbi:peptidase M23 [Roseibium sp. RKSG952]|nr:peptidase M23 [Roseibium sp. RKSG952]